MSFTIDGGGNFFNFPDIHGVSDGKLIKYNIFTRYSVEVKKKIIDCLIKLVDERANDSVKYYGIKGLTLIRDESGMSTNYQSVDNLLADDILVEISILLSDESDDEVIDTCINHLCEQMCDMIRTSGYCPSGRVNRVFQVFMILNDFRNNFHR